MVEILIIGFWGVIIISVIIGIIESIFFLISLNSMGESKGFKKIFLLLFSLSIIVIIYSISISIFFLKKYSISNIGWIIVPIGWVCVVTLFLMLSKDFSKIITKLQEEKRKIEND